MVWHYPNSPRNKFKPTHSTEKVIAHCILGPEQFILSGTTINSDSFVLRTRFIWVRPPLKMSDYQTSNSNAWMDNLASFYLGVLRFSYFGSWKRHLEYRSPLMMLRKQPRSFYEVGNIFIQEWNSMIEKEGNCRKLDLESWDLYVHFIKFGVFFYY